MGVTSQRAKLGPDRIRYWEGGADGKPIVLLHGFGADALWQWHPQIRALAETHRIIAPDLIWFGESTSEAREHSLEHQAKAVLALLDEEQVDDFHLIGVSYGGMVAHEIAGRAPNRVDRVVLVASPARAFLLADKKAVLRDFGVDSTEDLILPTTPAELERLMGLAFHQPPRVPRFIAQGVLDRYYRGHRDDHVELLRAVESNTTLHRERYEIPEAPTLIVWGEDDRVFPVRAAFRIHKELEGASQLCIFSEAAHAPHLERWEDVTALMKQFLDGKEVSCNPLEIR